MSMPRKAEAASYLRRRAVELSHAGNRQSKVADLLGISVRSLQRWNTVWQKGGTSALDAVATAGSPGRPPKLSTSETQEIIAWIVKDPIEFGFATSWWTARRLSELIRDRLGVSINHRYLSDWLRRHGVSPQVPDTQPAEKNVDRVKAWVRWQWPGVKRQVNALHATLGFTDEVGFLLSPLIRRTLAITGHTPVLRPRARQRDKVSAVAALTLSPTRGHAGLYFQTYPNAYINNQAYALFLHSLLSQIRGPLVLVHDNGNMHKGDPIREIQAAFPRLHLHHFPPYAPELNPPEYLWSHAKYYRLADFVPADVPEIDRTVESLLQEISHDQHRLKTFFYSSPLPWNNTTLLI
jgi:transposase